MKGPSIQSRYPQPTKKRLNNAFQDWPLQSMTASLCIKYPPHLEQEYLSALSPGRKTGFKVSDNRHLLDYNSGSIIRSAFSTKINPNLIGDLNARCAKPVKARFTCISPLLRCVSARLNQAPPDRGADLLIDSVKVVKNKHRHFYSFFGLILV